MQDILNWVETFKLSKPNKKLNRDFSDAVHTAEILKELFPKLVEIHNYWPKNAYSLKVENWETLNRKVLKKINIKISSVTIDKLARGEPGAAESLLFSIKERYSILEKFKRISRSKTDYQEEEISDIMTVSVKKDVNGTTVEHTQKLILYSVYETLEENFKEQKMAVDILTQKVQHLERLLKLKTMRVEALSRKLIKQSAAQEPNFSNGDVGYSDNNISNLNQ